MRDFKVIEMKRIRFFAFFLILILLLAGGSGIFRVIAQNSDEVAERNRSGLGLQKEKEDTIDVIFVGDSESYTSIIPPQMWQEKGFTSYTCGQAGQRAQETYSMLKRVFKRQSPKVVVIETNLMYRYENLATEIKKTLSESANYYFPIFRYHDMWKKFPFKNGNGEKLDFKGHDIRTEINAYTGDAAYMKETEESEEIHRYVKGYLDAVIKLCRENGAEVFFYSAPSPRNYNYKRHNAIQEYADENEVPYLDLNLKTEELGIDWSQDTLDQGDHLNLYGAQKVTKYIADVLAEQYELTDRRNDENYQEWNACAEAFQEQLK